MNRLFPFLVLLVFVSQGCFMEVAGQSLFGSRTIFGGCIDSLIVKEYNYSGDTLKGLDTDFSCAKFDSLAYFYRAKFDSRADFSFAKFDSLADFRSAQFHSWAYFRSAKFDSRAYFNSAKFDSVAYFSSAQFDSWADFSSAQFDSWADFSSAKFDSRADFLSAKFDSLADFSFAKFDSLADFKGAQFNYGVDFSDVQFSSLVDFQGVKFYSPNKPYSAKLGAHTNFHFALFDYPIENIRNKYKGIINLKGVILPDTIYFNEVKEIPEKEEVDFTFCKLDSGQIVCKINLVDSDISKIKLRYDRFQLIFPDTNYNYEQKLNVYEQLLKVQKEHGYLSSFEKLDKEYQKFKYLHNPNNDSTWVAKPINITANFLQKYWWDYGYNKAQILFWTLGFLLLFSIINWLLFDEMNEQVYQINYIFQPHKENAKYLWVLWDTTQYKFNIGLQQFIPAVIYTALIFFGLRMSVENVNYKNKIGVVYIYIQFALGLICLAYLVNFIILSK